MEQGLHSYASLDSCKKANTSIIKCIIPKKSLYYKRIHKDNISYTSDTLTYIKNL